MGTVRSSVPPLRNAVTISRNGGTDSLHFKKCNGPSNFRYISGSFLRYNLVRSSVPPFLRYLCLSERVCLAQGLRKASSVLSPIASRSPVSPAHLYRCPVSGNVTETPVYLRAPARLPRAGRTCDSAGRGRAGQLVSDESVRRKTRSDRFVVTLTMEEDQASPEDAIVSSVE